MDLSYHKFNMMSIVNCSEIYNSAFSLKKILIQNTLFSFNFFHTLYKFSEYESHVAFNQMIQDSEKASFDVVLIKESDLFSIEGICSDVYIFRSL